MNIVVDNKYITKGFISFLIRRIQMYTYSILNISKLRIYDEYFKSIYNVEISSIRVFKISTSNLKYKRNDTTTTIYINPDITYPGTQIKIIDLCRIINYGALNIPPYPIFTDISNQFTNNIKTYASKFTIGVGLF